jgi:hypothetical protein
MKIPTPEQHTILGGKVYVYKASPIAAPGSALELA